MKRQFIFPAITVFLFCACASEFKIMESDVPAIVLTSFKAKYPNALNTKWEAEKEKGHLVFEAEFKLDGKNKEAYFSPDGSFINEE